jgi:CRP/FNR family transcriptional regulator, cyclic AMP receptor protein
MDMQLVAWLAASLVFTSFFMKTIVPLRTVAIVSNMVFIGYALLGLHHGIFDKVLPILVLHLALLPLNTIRLNEVRRTIRSIRTMQTPSYLRGVIMRIRYSLWLAAQYFYQT